MIFLFLPLAMFAQEEKDSLKTYTTEEIKVEDSYKQNQNDLRTSLFNLKPTNIKILPGAIEDVLRSLKSLPGVTSPNDFTSQLVIRGSGPDQNLIIMDEVEIFNPYRLYGLVSMFNPETLSDINLITGGFPSKYGDRLSAVLDVSNIEGVRDKSFALTTNINIASANVIVQGKNPFSVPGSWLVSTRRTYYDLIVGPFARKAGLITEESTLPNFQDIQFKIAFGPFKKNKFFINGIFSKDGVDIVSGSGRTNPDSVNASDVTYNNVLSASWHFIPNANFISKTTIAWYKNSGNNDFEGDILDPLMDREGLTPGQRDSLRTIGALLGFNFKSTYSLRKISLGNRSTYNFDNKQIEFGGGVDIIRNDLLYKLDLDDAFRAFLRSIPGSQAFLEDFNITGKDNYRVNSYFQYRGMIGENFYFQPSFRVDYYSVLNKIYFSPRLNFGYAINTLTTLRAAIGVYYQSPGYEKLIDGQTFFDLTGNLDYLQAERAYHFILGVDRWVTSQWHLKVEGYYKRFDNLIIQKRETTYRYQYYLANPNNTDPNYIKNPANWIRTSTKVAVDSNTVVPINGQVGNAYGLELMLERRYLGPETKLYGWINYSYSKSTRDRLDEGFDYPYRFDQTHTINIVLNYRVNSWFEIGGRWTYATNFPYTPPKGITPRVVNDTIVVNPFTQSVVFNLDYGDHNNRNSERKPDYHRLDLRFTAYAKFWHADWSFYLDIINVYNRTNILAYQFKLNSQYQITTNTTGMLPILPTLGITARF